MKLKICEHILDNARQKGIILDHINIVDDHAHLLVSLKADQTLSSVAHLLKGESSHWINQQKLFAFKFQWQEEYHAISVSESAVPKVRKYIRNQEKHH